MSISTWKVKLFKLVPTVTALCTHNFACMNVHAKPFYVHKNQNMQILNLLSPAYVPKVYLSEVKVNIYLL